MTNFLVHGLDTACAGKKKVSSPTFHNALLRPFGKHVTDALQRCNRQVVKSESTRTVLRHVREKKRLKSCHETRPSSFRMLSTFNMLSKIKTLRPWRSFLVGFNRGWNQGWTRPRKTHFHTAFMRDSSHQLTWRSRTKANRERTSPPASRWPHSFSHSQRLIHSLTSLTHSHTDFDTHIHPFPSHSPPPLPSLPIPPTPTPLDTTQPP